MHTHRFRPEYTGTATGGPMLIDGQNLVMRNIKAAMLSDLEAGGVWTGGVFGSLRGLHSLIQQPDMRPSGIIMCFDAGMPPHRKELCPYYKEKRTEQRDLLSQEEKERSYEQIALCWEVFEELGITCLRYEDREADDTVAALARIFTAAGHKPIVVSGDKDLLQTVSMGAEFWDLNTKSWVTRDTFAEHIGVTADCFLLYKTLIGDSSDGLPGAFGCGPKKARDLVMDLAHHIDTASNGGFDLWDYSPEAQLDELAAFIEGRTETTKSGKVKPVKPKKFEQWIVDNLFDLNAELRTIDLSDSFGPTDALAARVCQLHRPPDLKNFLRFCTRLEMRSFLSMHTSFMRPFIESHRAYGALIDGRETLAQEGDLTN